MSVPSNPRAVTLALAASRSARSGLSITPSPPAGSVMGCKSTGPSALFVHGVVAETRGMFLEAAAPALQMRVG